MSQGPAPGCQPATEGEAEDEGGVGGGEREELVRGGGRKECR